MHKEHDERAKLIAEKALDCLGEVQRELEIPATDAMRFDLSLKRRHIDEVLPRYVVLAALLFDTDCMMEVFSQAVPLSDFWDSQLKQLAWRRQEQQKVKAQPGPTPTVRLSRLWIISAGRPEALFVEYTVRPRAGFPNGIYDVGEGLNIGLIVVSELPPGPETLLLRLMGSAAVCDQAVEELRSMPEGDPETAELLRILSYLQHTLRRAKDVSDEVTTKMIETWAKFERHEQSLVEKGMEKGMEKSLRKSIVYMCELIGIPVSAEHCEQLEGMRLEALQSLQEQIRRTRAWPV